MTNANSLQTSVTMNGSRTVRAVFETAIPLGQQTSHRVNRVSFHMRLAPAATFPTGTDDTGTTRKGEPFMPEYG